MSKEIDNGGTCPFCFNKVHPQAIACNGCGASYKKDKYSFEARMSGAVISIILLFGTLALLGGIIDANVGVIIGCIASFIFAFLLYRRVSSRLKYKWFRYQ